MACTTIGTCDLPFITVLVAMRGGVDAVCAYCSVSYIKATPYLLVSGFVRTRGVFPFTIGETCRRSTHLDQGP